MWVLAVTCGRWMRWRDSCAVGIQTPDSILDLVQSYAVYCNHKRGQCIFHFAIHFCFVSLCVFSFQPLIWPENALNPSLSRQRKEKGRRKNERKRNEKRERKKAKESEPRKHRNQRPWEPISNPHPSPTSPSPLPLFFLSSRLSLSFYPFLETVLSINEVWFWKEMCNLGVLRVKRPKQNNLNATSTETAARNLKDL